MRDKSRPAIVVVMGVSGSGKTTLCRGLEEAFGAARLEGDDFHGAENLGKMSSGTPLTDEDRLPWLRDINAQLHSMTEPGGGGKRVVVLACSALKDSYRKEIERGFSRGELRWVHLACDEATLARRMRERSHFMPPSLLESQIETLEPPEAENCIRLDATRPVSELVERVRRELQP
ncbi:carbohydrate kinase [Chloropicon primus]|uniref:Gluconokinase n=1 Tax=Chloropicon primus TaxID=1764295 RepID=A0A5B8MBN3_9CHLO|nr:carbohydrate kinase [Chloropicon primus]UPQ96994.1 carbohydrate kinase [Chloropicon primus]|eukprot:QDZ17777.1 carbohydrate kinase [Chloropicon primus]